jgi:transcriptional regulator with XRE-family HTH domain
MDNGNAKRTASAVANKKSPNSVDRPVGARIRMRRSMLTLSQTQLGDALGLTFQQVQKYEKGTNRVGASRLQHILQVPGSFFFEEIPIDRNRTSPDFGHAVSRICQRICIYDRRSYPSIYDHKKYHATALHRPPGGANCETPQSARCRFLALNGHPRLRAIEA